MSCKRTRQRFRSSISVKVPLAISMILPILFASSMSWADGFGKAKVWHPAFGNTNEVLLTGDFNRDKRADLIAFSRDGDGPGYRGDVWVSLATATGTTSNQKWHDFFSVSQQVPKVGDFNGDGYDDVVNFVKDTYTGDARGDVEVALSDGVHFLESRIWNGWFSIANEIPDVGDFNGDGLDDIITFLPDSGVAYVAISSGSFFGPGQIWTTTGCTGRQAPVIGDFNGDKRADFACFIQSTQPEPALGDVYVSLSDGSKFLSPVRWHGFFSVNNELARAGDVNGDGKDDIITFVREAPDSNRGNVWVAFSTGSAFTGSQLWHDEFCFGTSICYVDDFNGDGRDDVVEFKPETDPVAPQQVQVALNAALSVEEPSYRHAVFGYGAMKTNGRLPSGGRPLVVAMVDFSDRQFDATHTKSFYRSLLTGFNFPTLKFYMQEISSGIFRWDIQGIYGTYRYPNDPSTTPNESTRQCAYNYPSGATTLCPGSSSSEFKLRAWAIRQTAKSVDYKNFDLNNDGKVTDDEVGFLMINASVATDHGGGTRGSDPGCVRVGTVDRQVDVCVGVPDVTGTASLMTMAHELMHPMGAKDLYNNDGQNTLISLFGPTIFPNADDRRVFHLDPWHKMIAGWIRPRIFDVREPGSCAILESAQYGGTTASRNRRPILIYDPRRGTREFILLEHRDSTAIANGQYDQSVASNGLGIWHAYVKADLRTPVSVPSRLITAGTNGVLNSVIPFGSDDIQIDTDGNGIMDRILAGADQILQTAPGGDDVNPLDLMVSHWGAPTGARGGNTLWTPAHGRINVRWWNNSDMNLKIRTAAGPRPGTIAVRWGWNDLNVPPRPAFISDPEIRDCFSRF